MSELPVIGWREWVALPLLQSRPLKAKIDSGAKTCALHASYIETFLRADIPWVRFGIRAQLRKELLVHCEAPLKDQREVRDSGGHSERRCVIETAMLLGAQRFYAELTLTDRATLQYRMLIGRNVLRDCFLIDSGRSFALGKPALDASHELQ
ncbi:MAG TPA: RimK/LysX family protein [Spongiibacteraceae bacterium]|jgi:hypothetical protein